MAVISMVHRPKMKFTETYAMKATSELEKTLDTRYIHGREAYLQPGDNTLTSCNSHS